MRKIKINLPTRQDKPQALFNEDTPKINFALNSDLITEIRQ
jgi:hypothetical protein